MSSNIRIQRICEYCGHEFQAMTTVTRFCSKTCNSKAYKLKIKDLKVASSNHETRMQLNQPFEELKSKEFLSIVETCKLLGISRMTLHRQIQRKAIEPGRIGRRIIFRKEDINSLLE